MSNAAAVAPDTRARVMATVEEPGYRPNLAARNLRRRGTGLTGVVVPESRRSAGACTRGDGLWVFLGLKGPEAAEEVARDVYARAAEADDVDASVAGDVGQES